MSAPLILRAIIDEKSNIVDFYTYLEAFTTLSKVNVMEVIDCIIDISKSFRGKVLDYDHAHLEVKPTQIGISFSIRFRDNRDLHKFCNAISGRW